MFVICKAPCSLCPCKLQDRSEVVTSLPSRKLIIQTLEGLEVLHDASLQLWCRVGSYDLGRTTTVGADSGGSALQCNRSLKLAHCYVKHAILSIVGMDM